MRYPREINCQVLVEKFFEPVRDDLQYKIKGSLGNMPYETVFSSSEVLYLIRNDYIHNGNFVGLFFKGDATEEGIPNGGTFWYANKNDKTRLVLADSECKLTYDEFLKIFTKAFEENIKLYSQISQTAKVSRELTR
jgi:hypothetical protein